MGGRHLMLAHSQYSVCYDTPRTRSCNQRHSGRGRGVPHNCNRTVLTSLHHSARAFPALASGVA